MQFKQRSAYIALGVVFVVVGLLGMASISWAEGDTWTKKADWPVPRLAFSATAVDGNIYAIGGELTMGGEPISTVEEYDPATDTWATKADIPTARACFSTSVVNGKIYAIGGMKQEPGLKMDLLSSVEEYDPVTDTWTTKKGEIPTARWHVSTGVVNGKIYAIGGGVFEESGPFMFSDVEEYDPVTDTWTKKTHMPTARAGSFAGVVNGRIYVIGGFKADLTWLSTVEEYDPVKDTWTKKTPMPTARLLGGTSVMNGKIYTIGGRNIQVDPMDPPFSTVEAYDPVKDTWTKKADMPMARFLFSASAVDGKIYALGGAGTTLPPFTLVSTVLEYDPGLVPTAVEEVSEETALPSGYALSQNYPNPFNPLTIIAYDLPGTSNVTLTIYTITGQKVVVLVDGKQEAGHHRALFDGSGFSNGVYLYRLEAGRFVETQTMVLLK